MSRIKTVIAREILDSRGNPTIETRVDLEDGSMGVSSVPSGASLGAYEAHELRDGDMNRYRGMGVLKAVANVNQIIAPKIIGIDSAQQKEIDRLMITLDGTLNKKILGGNAVLSVSLAICEATAVSLKLPLYSYVAQISGNSTALKIPTPTFNLINGGKHGAGNLDFQEFHVIPTQRKTYSEGLEIGEEIYQTIKDVLIYRGAVHSVGDEGGFAPNLFTNLDALEILTQAISQTPHKFGEDVFLGLDVAASTFYKDGKYAIKDRSQPFSRKELIEYYQDLNTNYKLLYLEDPIDEDDWDGWQEITNLLGPEMIIVGDDLLVTNKERLRKAIDQKACNAILVKPNQAGTLTETFEVIKTAQEAGFKTIVSHRSGETEETFVADLAVGTGADYVKFGAPARGERVAKYNRLLAIESELQRPIIGT